MSMIVQHNLTAMNANRMLGMTTTAQAKSSEKLASGYRINRAADDAAGLSISEKMRKQIRGLTQASRNAQDGISAVQTAEGALTEVQDMLQRMNELAVQASNSTNSETDRQAIQDEIDQLVTEIDRVSETTKFNETYLLKGDRSEAAGVDYTYNASPLVASQTLYTIATDNSVTVVEAGTVLDTSATYYTEKSAVGVQISSTDLTGATYATAADVVDATGYYLLNTAGEFVEVASGAKYDSSATYYTVTSTAGGAITYQAVASTAVTTGSGYFAVTTIYDKDGNAVASGAAIDATATYYSSVSDRVITGSVADISTVSVTGEGFQFMDKDGNEIAANGLYRYFDDEGNYDAEANSGLYITGADGEIRKATEAEVKAYVSETSATVGSLSLSFQVGADATADNKITIKLDAMDSVSLGIKNVSVAGNNDENARNAIETIAAALDRVSAQRASLGAIQNRLEHTINNLDNVVENTTSAESQIRDTDMASEMVTYSKNNILAQAGQSMLAQANQATQGVLSLLG